MKKRLLTLLITGIMALSLAACGKAADDTSNTVNEAVSEEDEAKGTSDVTDDSSDAETETIDEADEVADDATEAPDLDIAGCDTFTQIVDTVLTDGMGYANEKICDTDVLLVSSGTYDNLDGNNAAIDSTVFIYKDGVPFKIGEVASGGTAYPITVNDGYLYTGSNHWICKYAIADDKLMIMEHAMVTYDTDGNETYTYDSEDGGDYSNLDPAEAENIYNELIDELLSGTIVNYSTVTK